MKRVLVMASTFPRWAGDTVPPFVFQLSERLANLGYEMHILAPHASGAATRETLGPLEVHRFRYAPASMETLAYGGGILENLKANSLRWGLVPAFFASQYFSTWWLNRQLKFDLIHVHWLIPQGLTSAALPAWISTPKLLTAHGGDVFASKTGLKKNIVKFVADRHDAITVNSTAMGQAVADLTGKSSTVIPMGVDLNRFSNLNGTPFTTSQSPHHMMFVGRLAEKKGVEYLVRAMPAIRAAVPDVKLTIVGDGPRRKELEAEVAQANLGDAVTFAGAWPNSELPEFYRDADLFIAPSVVAKDGDTEALGVVLLEAAGCGLPIVSTRVGGIPDVIKHNETGVLVDERSADQVASACIDLLKNRSRALTLGRAARSHAIANYSWDSVASRFARAYDELIAGKTVIDQTSMVKGRAA